MRSLLHAKLNSKLEHGLRKLQDRAPSVVAGAIDEIIDRAIPNASRRAQETDLPTLAPRSAPPTEVQTYGPELESSDHSVRQAFFKYSQCSGKKRALLIGITYAGSDVQLRGCINDVKNVKRFITERYGYDESDIVTLTDDNSDPGRRPTKSNIIRWMDWLVKDAQPDDSLLFQYSGHGSQVKDQDGDEADGFDECILPVDYKEVGVITDDVLHMKMVKPLPPGCRLTAIFDSCHSGSALDLPFLYSTEGKLKEPNILLESGRTMVATVDKLSLSRLRSLASPPKSNSSSSPNSPDSPDAPSRIDTLTAGLDTVINDMSGLVRGARGVMRVASGDVRKATEYAKETRRSAADVISWSGCKDSQTSMDTVMNGVATGAMSYAFIKTLTETPEQSYQELLVSLRETLAEKQFSQKPQLSSSHPIDTNVLFVM